jgi:hypothetical protein
MCKSSKGTKTANPALEERRKIKPATDSGGGGGGGGGGSSSGPDPEASAPPTIMFAPDFAPQLTFIAAASPTDNGFIAQAIKYHTQAGLKPITITSFEDLLDKLLDTTKTGSGWINRMRIVSHVFVSGNALDNPANMKLPFLQGGTRNSFKRYFTGFGGTKMDALRAMMGFEYKTVNNITIYICQNPGSEIIAAARKPATSAIFNKIPTDGLGEPNPDYTDFLRICASKWLMSKLPAAPHFTAFDLAYDLLLADVIPKLAGTLTVIELNTVRDAVLAISSPFTYEQATPLKAAEFGADLSVAITAIQADRIKPKLIEVRKRIDKGSRIDIRGCQVGRDPGFLEAIQFFFGTDATRRPTVSGPKWFQHFNPIGFASARNEGNIITMYNSGIPSVGSAVQMRTFFEQWADGFGIKANHVTFWQTTFGLGALDFCALQWRNTLPATTVTVPRLQSLGTANFDALLQQLASIFFLPTATALSAGDLSGITPLLPQCATWSTQLNANVPDTATDAALQTTLANYKVIYEKLDRRVGSGTPPTEAQRIIPSTAPATLTFTEVRNFQTKLKQFIDTNTNSRLVKVKTLVNAGLTKISDAPGKLRYFLGLGLPFLVYNAAANSADANRLIFFEDMTGTAAAGRQTDAVKFWVRAQWRGVIPADIGKNLVYNDGMETPWLVENHQPGPTLTLRPFVLSPTPEYQDKIVTVNA